VRSQGRLVGLAPLVVRRRGPVRLVRVLGKEPADYWDVLALPAEREAATRAAIEVLRAQSRSWDLLVLDCLPPGSPTEELLVRSPLRVRRRPATPCPGLDLPDSFEGFLGGLERKRRSKLRKLLRRLDEGEVELRAPREPEEIPAAVERWHRLRLRQWEATGKALDPLHRTDRFRDFAREALLGLVPADRAVIWEFLVDGRQVGSYVNFVDERAWYYFLGGFDPTSSHLGLGTTSVALAIRSSIERGRRYYDFMAGSEPYKYWYGATDRFSASLALGGAHPRSRAALAASGLRDRVRGRGGRRAG
jgi:CelD/BcsL family acetyltransferase involved in cellulose biosynthesis